MHRQIPILKAWCKEFGVEFVGLDTIYENETMIFYFNYKHFTCAIIYRLMEPALTVKSKIAERISNKILESN